MAGKCGEKGCRGRAHDGVRPVLAWAPGAGRGGSPGDGDPFRIPEGETLTRELWDHGGGRELGEPQNEKKKEGEGQRCLERQSHSPNLRLCIWIHTGCRINLERLSYFLKIGFGKLKSQKNMTNVHFHRTNNFECLSVFFSVYLNTIQIM